MTIEEYQLAVVNGLADISSKLTDILTIMGVLCLIVSSAFIYHVIHNMTNRR